MLARALARLRQRATAPALSVSEGAAGTPGTSSNGAGLPVPKAEDGPGTAGTPGRPGPGERENVPTVPEPRPEPGTPEVQQIRACPRRPSENDHADAASAERSREQPDSARWPDLDALRRSYGEARGVEAKRVVVTAWAEATGGRVTGGALRLLGDLPNTLTLATLKAYARCVGLVVAEPACVWCPNPPLPGDRLCDHCRWLAGDWRRLPPAGARP
jgi:hypothetical protein